MKKLLIATGQDPVEVDMTEEEIASLPPPEPTVIPPISRRQLRLWLLTQGKTDADVRAAIGAIPDPVARAAALIEWEDSTTYDRTHPLVTTLGAALGFSAEAMNAGFREAAAL